MRKIKVKTLYLIAIVVGGLIGLATKSTYALFTSSTEIDNPICMATNLTSEEEVVDTLDVVVASGEVKEVPVTINNTSGSPLNYMVFYNPTSNDIVIGTNMKNADSSNSLGTINTNETKKVYVQIKNNGSSNITITLGVVSNSISSDMNLVPSSKEGESTIITAINLAEYITSLYTNTTKTTVTNNSITYNYATSVNLMNDRLGSSSTPIDNGNIRYYGNNPSNYIYFNCQSYPSTGCELWRIVGVFDGKVKIIRNDTIGKYSWDNKDKTTGIGTDSGRNDWSKARLMKLLNPSDYYTVDSNDGGKGQSLYWNSQSGTCFSGQNNATTSCNFTSTGIKNDTTRNIIAESTWYLQGSTSENVYSNQMYEYERTKGSTVSSNPISWIGKVTIPYPSDYGYAVDLRECSKTLKYYNDSVCTSKNWMKSVITSNSNHKSWFLTPFSNDTNLTYFLSETGELSLNYGYDVFNNYGVTPTLYLESKIKIKESTTGSSSNPYQIVIE